MSLYSFATPACVQSRPIMVSTWPSASDLVMVPSMSEMTTGTSYRHRYILAEHVARLTVKLMLLMPDVSFSAFSWSLVSRSVLA